MVVFFIENVKWLYMSFEELEWHDAVIKKAEIDRSDPGIIDSIAIEMDWPDETKSRILFENVAWASLNLYYYYLGKDYVLKATVIENIDENVAQYFTKRTHQLDTMVNFYHIKSSISEITILAKSIRVISTTG